METTFLPWENGAVQWAPDSIPAPAVVAAASAVVLVVGWRGRRVNRHPICRRCEFDLFGRPAEATRCAECGADLRRRAVHRRVTITGANGGFFHRDFGWVNYTVGGWSPLRGGWSLPLNDGVIGRLADGPQRATVEVVIEAYDSPGAITGKQPVATTHYTLNAR